MTQTIKSSASGGISTRAARAGAGRARLLRARLSPYRQHHRRADRGGSLPPRRSVADRAATAGPVRGQSRHRPPGDQPSPRPRAGHHHPGQGHLRPLARHGRGGLPPARDHRDVDGRRLRRRAAAGSADTAGERSSRPGCFTGSRASRSSICGASSSAAACPSSIRWSTWSTTSTGPWSSPSCRSPPSTACCSPAAGRACPSGRLTIQAVSLDAEAARYLKVPEGSPAFCLEHLFLDFEGRPVSWGRFLCRADQFRLSTSIGVAPARPEETEEP